MGSGLWVLPTKIYHYKLKKIDIKRNKLFCKMILVIVEAIQTRGSLLSFWLTILCHLLSKHFAQYIDYSFIFIFNNVKQSILNKTV